MTYGHAFKIVLIGGLVGGAAAYGATIVLPRAFGTAPDTMSGALLVGALGLAAQLYAIKNWT
jgi:hypothetical protein